MKQKIVVIFLLIFMVCLVSGYDPHKQETNFTYSETVANADQCNLTSINYPDGNTNNLNIAMNKNGFEFSTIISSGNFTQVGITCMSIICYDSDATPEYIDGKKCLDINLSGTNQDTSSAMASLIIITFLILLIIVTLITTRKINYEKWYSSLINKYQNKNYIRLVLGSIGYNILKNNYIIYYLLGFPIIIAITNLVYDFGIVGMIDIMKVYLGLYSIGIIIVGIYLFGHIQEWIIDLMEQIKDIDWGVEQ